MTGIALVLVMLMMVSMDAVVLQGQAQQVVVYNVTNNLFDCRHDITVNTVFGKCSNGVAASPMEVLPLNTAARKRNWVSLCGLQCLTRSLNAPNEAFRCVGFRRNGDKCTLVQCPADARVLSPSVKSRTKTKTPQQTTVMDLATCFSPRVTSAPSRPGPTKRPTSQAPTRRPTPPTASPIPKCTVPGLYADDFKSLEGANAKLELYKPITGKAERALCEIIRPNKVFGQIEGVTNFACSLEACIRWCTYASLCNYVMYSAVAKTCQRASYLEVTDDDTNYVDYHSKQYQVYAKLTSTDIRYYSGRCNELTPLNCGPEPECEWNRGKKGYNDPIQGGGAGGYCGRVKCLAEQARSG